jgi:hypothetical protein
MRPSPSSVEAIALHSTQVRLARFLLAAISMKGQGDANSRSIVLNLGMSQTELGLLLGASRSKVNEALATLETLGAIHSTTGHIECDVGALQDIARDSPNDPDRSHVLRRVRGVEEKANVSLLQDTSDQPVILRGRETASLA